MELNCSDPTLPQKDKVVTIDFIQTLIPNFLLGQTDEFALIRREQFSASSQRLDVKMTYSCDNTWTIRSKTRPTYMDVSNITKILVNPETCEHVDPASASSVEARWIGCLFDENSCPAHSKELEGGMPPKCRESSHAANETFS